MRGGNSMKVGRGSYAKYELDEKRIKNRKKKKKVHTFVHKTTKE